MDKDLSFLAKCRNEDLKVLADYLEKKGGITAELSLSEAYRTHYPNNCKELAEAMADELQRYGGNSIMNFFRSGGVPYREILIDVATKLKVNFNKESSVERIEELLLQKICIDALEKMSEEDLQELVKEQGLPIDHHIIKAGKNALLPVLITLIKTGGFASYKIAVIVANAIARLILGRGLAFAGNATLTRTLSIFAGPVGWIIAGIWTLFDVASPAYRVTIPCVIHVAYMRATLGENN